MKIFRKNPSEKESVQPLRNNKNLVVGRNEKTQKRRGSEKVFSNKKDQREKKKSEVTRGTP